MKPPRHEITAVFVASHPPETVRRAVAIRLAKACREIVQACLREEEWADADAAFAEEIEKSLDELDAVREEVSRIRT